MFKKISTKSISLLLSASLLFGLSIGVLPVPKAQAIQPSGTSYYVDATGGSDSNEGTSDSTAWKTLERVSATNFQPGDRILFKSGEVWEGQLWPKGSGSEGNPIIIDAYGSGSKPAIQGNGTVNDAVRLFNQEYWEIHNLDVSNEVAPTSTPGENLGDYRGIHISGDNSTTLDYFRIESVDVHDVTGEIHWISGTQPIPPEPGIRFKTGWDGSKKTGGIVFDTTVPDIYNPPAQATILNDVVVEKSTVSNTSFAGIVFKQYTGDGKDQDGTTIATSTGWGERSSDTDPKFTPHTNVTIRDNFITQQNTDYGCNGMYLTDIRGGLVEGNVVYRTGTSGIEMYYADDIVVQHNEVYETTQKAGGADSNGIDPDKATTNIIIQYNYIHDNGDGILICQFSFGDTIIRNNVIKSNSRYPIYLHSDRKAVAQVYNNTIYNDKSNYLIYGYGSSLDATYHIKNNNLYTTRAGATITTSGTTFYENNNYYGSNLTIPAVDAKAIQVDPKFVSTVAGPSGTAETGPMLDSALGFRSQSGSGVINAGLVMSDNGGKDYAGSILYNGAPDIGAFEYYTAEGSTTESLNGKVRDGAGKPVAGVKLTLTVNGTPYMATTDAKGTYVIADVPLTLQAELKAEKAGYETVTTNVDIQPPNMTTQDVVITSTSPYGSLSANILDEKMDPLADAAVQVLYESEVLASGNSDAAGVVHMTQVPIGDGYSIQVSKPGYFAASKSNIAITPESQTDIGSLLLSSKQPQVLYDHKFNDMASGNMSSQDDLTVSTSGGKVEITEVPDTSDKSVRLTRSSNSGNTTLSEAFATPLKGIVTIEADLMRNDTYTSGNNWFSLPYVYGTSPSSSSPGVSFAFDKGKMKAYKGTASVELMSYNVGQWYNMRMVIDTAAQRFDLYIDGEKLVDQAAFRQSMTDIKRIDFYANSSNYGSVNVDNIRVTQGIGYSKTDATLSSISSSAGELTRLDETHYSIQVPSETEQITLTPTASSPNAASVTVNEISVSSGTVSVPIELTGDQTDIPVVVTAEDNKTMVSYTVTVNRISPLMDASLRGLEISSGTLSPDFNKDTLEYTVKVPYEVAYMTFTPTASNSQADISINEKSIASGHESSEIPLLVGENEIELLVVSQDGTANAIYKVVVTREVNSKGAVTGIVQDTGANHLSGVLVTLTDGVHNYSGHTDPSGSFTFSSIEPGSNYQLSASKAGYEDATLQGIEVTAGQTTSGLQVTLPANRAVASLHGKTSVRAGEVLDSAFRISNVSASVYSAVYTAEINITFDTNQVEWLSVDTDLPKLSFEQKELTDEGHLAVKVAMQDNQPLPADTDLFNAHWKAKESAALSETSIGLTAVFENGWGEAFNGVPSEHAFVVTKDWKTALQSLMEETQLIYDQSVEGDHKGEYPAGAKAPLAASLSEAGAVLSDVIATDVQWQQAFDHLEQAKQIFLVLVRSEDAGSSDGNNGESDNDGSSGGSNGSDDIGSGSDGNSDNSNSGGSDGSSNSGSSSSSSDQTTSTDTGIDTSKPGVTATADSKGTAVISKKAFEHAVSTATTDESGKKVVQIKVQSTDSKKEYGVQLPASSLTGGKGSYSIQLETPAGTLVLSNEMLSGPTSAQTVEVRLAQLPKENLNTADQNRFGQRPVLDMQVLVDGKAISWNNPEAPVTVKVPYEPSNRELQNPEQIAVVYVDGNGHVTPVPNGHYDASTGQVVFATKHFSRYGVVFEPKSFTDLTDVEWARKSIETLASRGVIEGVTNRSFNPQDSITRADFLVLLVRALEFQSKTSASFDDVQPDAYYASAISTARAYGITSGSGDNQFQPGQLITREDTMVLTARALEAAKQLSSSDTSAQPAAFRDAADISNYAVSSIAALTASGFVQGDESGLHPKENLSRAQAAAMLYRILVKQ
ncbi:S-layer homology domain-containing protein [Paenibacillus hexagrammi]|uniref:Carboxypeptidase regulatory-like domain-containing protein n=1 Tax=Paenibacillus hexagrammi TaxID=2908839 RepID=A0ABY3SMY4_9BACL|nr:S-layer homology domain-containing protein [Paenibacillus sp. YPD9-1]UJF34843.1 carboxypeptidase regulatory-like domain-containing protein [Paenibacillus sp. YPD9-1]